MTERLLKFYDCEHLSPELQTISRPFQAMARGIIDNLEPGPERTVSLRKLLEAKDAAVRAHVYPGG